MSRNSPVAQISHLTLPRRTVLALGLAAALAAPVLPVLAAPSVALSPAVGLPAGARQIAVCQADEVHQLAIFKVLVSSPQAPGVQLPAFAVNVFKTGDGPEGGQGPTLTGQFLLVQKPTENGMLVFLDQQTQGQRFALVLAALGAAEPGERAVPSGGVVQMVAEHEAIPGLWVTCVPLTDI